MLLLLIAVVILGFCLIAKGEDATILSLGMDTPQNDPFFQDVRHAIEAVNLGEKEAGKRAFLSILAKNQNHFDANNIYGTVKITQFSLQPSFTHLRLAN